MGSALEAGVSWDRFQGPQDAKNRRCAVYGVNDGVPIIYSGSSDRGSFMSEHSAIPVSIPTSSMSTSNYAPQHPGLLSLDNAGVSPMHIIPPSGQHFRTRVRTSDEEEDC